MELAPVLNGHAHEPADERARDIRIDPEFAALMPFLSRDELAQMERSLLLEGCHDALIVWRGILVDGHNRLLLCRKHGIAFRVEEREFPDRTAALAWIIVNQGCKRNLSPEASSYFRGKRYLAAKQAHGGDRANGQASGQNDHLKTAERLAQEYKVGEATIRRDGQFARVLDRIAANCGTRARQTILARDSGVRRTRVLRLARLSIAEQQEAIAYLLEHGTLPRSSGGVQKTIAVPTLPAALAATVLRKLGPQVSRQAMHAFGELLARHGLPA